MFRPMKNENIKEALINIFTVCTTDHGTCHGILCTEPIRWHSSRTQHIKHCQEAIMFIQLIISYCHAPLSPSLSPCLSNEQTHRAQCVFVSGHRLSGTKNKSVGVFHRIVMKHCILLISLNYPPVNMKDNDLSRM